MSAPLRLIQVGLGVWGSDWADTVLPAAGSVEVVASVDARWADEPPPDGEAPAAAPAFASLAEALGAIAADAVLVTVGIEAHRAVAAEALRAGKHVLLEKPFAVTEADAAALVAEARRVDRRLVVAQNYRFWPAAAVVRRAVADDVIGRVQHVRIDFRRDHDDYGPALAARPGSPTSSVLYQIAVHHLDLVRFVLGEARVLDAARWRHGQVPGRTLTAFSATLDLESGARVEYSANQASHAPSTAWTGLWRIEGERGALTWQASAPGVDDAAFVRLGRSPDAVQDRSITPDGLVDRAAVLAEFAALVADDARSSGISGEANLGTMALVQRLATLLELTKGEHP